MTSPASLRSIGAVGVGVALGLSILVGACSNGVTDPAGSVTDPDTLVAFFINDSENPLELRLVGGQTGGLIGRRRPGASSPGLPVFGGALGADADQEQRLLVAAFTPADSFSVEHTRLVGLGYPDLEVLWSEAFRSIRRRAGGPLRITAVERIGRGGRWLFLRAERGEEKGVLAVERTTRKPAAFLGGFVDDRRAITDVEATSAGRRLLVVGGPRPSGTARLMIYRAGDLALRDSVSMAETPTGNFSAFKSLASAHDGRHVYAVGVDSLFKVDVRAGQVDVRSPRQRPGLSSRLAVTEDPERLFLTDPRNFRAPARGRLQVYDAGLRDLGTVNLHSEKIEGGGGLPAMVGLDVGEDGERLFVAGGTDDLVTGFFQKANISVVDPEAMTLVRTHVFDRFSLGGVFAF